VSMRALNPCPYFSFNPSVSSPLAQSHSFKLRLSAGAGLAGVVGTGAAQGGSATNGANAG